MLIDLSGTSERKGVWRFKRLNKSEAVGYLAPVSHRALTEGPPYWCIERGKQTYEASSLNHQSRMMIKPVVIITTIATLSTATGATPVSHHRGVDSKPSPSHQQQDHTKLQEGIHNQDKHSLHYYQSPAHHERQASDIDWIDSLFADGDAPSHSPSEHGRELADARAKGPMIEHQQPQSQQAWLRWVEKYLNDDHFDDVRPGTSSTSSALQDQSTSPSLILDTSQHGTPTPANAHSIKPAHLAPTGRIYKPAWTLGRTVEEQDRIRKKLDELVIAKYGFVTRRRRHYIVRSLTKEQLDYLGKSQLPADASTHQKASNATPKSTAERSQPNQTFTTRVRRKSWKEGLNHTEVQTILAFGDTLMSQRKATSLSTRNDLISSLSRDELKAIARGDELEKERIIVKLAPKKLRRGPWFYERMQSFKDKPSDSDVA